MQLPLFHGVSSQQLSELVAKMPFHFLKYRDGDVITTAGETCTHMRFVVSGTAHVQVQFQNLQVSITQDILAPNVLGADYLFGLETRYPFTVTAKGECGIMQLRKADYIAILQSDKVFLFNILNYLSSNSQRPTTGLMNMRVGSVVERLAFMVGTVTKQASTNVSIHFMQKELCVLLGTQRATLIKALDSLQNKGLIYYSTTRIDIIDLQRLLQQSKG